ncbi:hypothetical protein, partial [Bradyrhizobium sp. 35]|uniref:hypothetical protein n=1 Tax=Bradyrhizobium sp. 35 TaxID=2782670 RepID=UPI001FF8FD67
MEVSARKKPGVPRQLDNCGRLTRARSGDALEIAHEHCGAARGKRTPEGCFYQYHLPLEDVEIAQCMRIPTKPAMHSNSKPAGYSDRKPATRGVVRMGQ